MCCWPMVKLELGSNYENLMDGRTEARKKYGAKKKNQWLVTWSNDSEAEADFLKHLQSTFNEIQEAEDNLFEFE